MSAADEAQVREAFAAMAETPEGGITYLHCRGGCGRTGTVLGCYLIEQGAEPEEALTQLQALTRPMWASRYEDCPQTVAQKNVVRHWRPTPDPGARRPVVSVDEAAGRVRGCLLGGAVGDALGAGIEFASIAQIRQRFGPVGVTGMTEAHGRLGAITDDAQMTLFTAEGLLRAHVRGAAKGIYPDFRAVVDQAYARWLLTQGARSGRWGEFWSHMEPPGPDGWLIGVQDLHHRRAPGNTCVSALASERANSVDSPLNYSKGCGGVMRMAPAGLLSPNMGLTPSVSPFEIGRDLAALTHGHPSGYLSAAALAGIIHEIVWFGAALEEALDEVQQELATQPDSAETLEALTQARELYGRKLEPTLEAIAELGEGWVGEEALAIAVYCALVAGDFGEGVLLAVNHSGDSDSTGAIAGNILGALHGADAIPRTWLADLELREEINELADDWIKCARDPSQLGDGEVADDWWWDRYPGH